MVVVGKCDDVRSIVISRVVNIDISIYALIVDCARTYSAYESLGLENLLSCIHSS